LERFRALLKESLREGEVNVPYPHSHPLCTMPNTTRRGRSERAVSLIAEGVPNPIPTSVQVGL
jgi:hypothetical protein